MIRSYLTIAFRNLWKNRAHTLINVLGLALGIASSIVIFFIVRFELSYDNFHEKADRIYRITSTFEQEGKLRYNNAVPFPLPEAFQQDFADDIEEVLIVEQTGGRVILDGETTFIDEGKVFTENAYFSFFDFPLVAGNPKTVLQQPNEVVLSQSLYRKLFNSEEYELGKTLSFRNDTTYLLEVTGILADLPKNTDLQFEFLVSYSTMPEETNASWESWFSNFNAFVCLAEDVQPAALSSQFQEFLKKYRNAEDVEKHKQGLRLQPLSEMHHNNQYAGFPYRKMPKFMLSGLVILAVLLITLACVNFTNLATAISSKRAKEVGVRKTLGSSRRQIVLSFLGEAFIVTVLATALAFGLAELGLIQLKKLYTHLQPITIQFGWMSIGFFLLLVLLVANLAGFYPAWLLSRFKPIQALKSATSLTCSRRFSLRHALVIFQFFVSQLFIVCVLVIAQQLNYLKNAPLGFDKEAILTIDLQDEEAKSRKRFEAALSKESAVKNLTFTSASAISQSMTGAIYSVDGKETERQVNLHYADHRFFDTHGMNLLAGSVFTPSDSGIAFVANEAFVKDLGLDNPEQALGKFIEVMNIELPIVGVVSNYHTASFTSKIPPLLITNRSEHYYNLSMKVDLTRAQTVIAKLEQVWQTTYPEYDFRYDFLDDKVASFYKSYDRTFSLAQIFAGIAIFISCLGLYGLVMFMAERRTKEVGIRKVLGASVQQIVALFSKEFVKLIFVAFILAAPLAYYLMQQWLRNFAYTIEVNAFTFAISLVAIITIVLLTVGYQSIKAAIANPVDALRDE
ncbi:ABC transporter permease [Tunicatimonas pelagia]|uniref:ABC transporter permease n=1 Tax=Tunicatimonas pelagia TaxID=931531 RepID=UPI00266689E7|nr:ABC transporter permease [Tunicatimonas pelagia]WKN42572.1 ABC transporter permease [Tunicatimonas pelagia]